MAVTRFEIFLPVVVSLAVALPSIAVDRDAAYSLVSQRVAGNRQVFYVYQDADAGTNHGFASGFFGSFTKIEVDAACVDDAAAANGCATDTTRLDRTRGNVLRMTFAPLGSTEFAGVNFEEPENWGAQNRGTGYDLRGATELVLDVRSPTPGGVRVQFGVDGKTTDFMLIAQSPAFHTITIPLSSLRPQPGILSDVHILFTVVTNGSNAASGSTLLLDDVRFSPPPSARATALGFPLATQTFGVLPVQNQLSGRVPIPPDQANRNVATIYESALVLQALLERGTGEDRELARIIADTFVYAASHENHGLPLPAAPDGSRGLHSGYESGDIALKNEQAPGSGQAGDVRLAGFSASAQQCGPSRYCPILDDATGGNVAFAILGLLAAFRSLGDPAYLDTARTLGQWIYANLRDPASNGFGGYFLGYPGGALPKTDPLRAKLTENNADLFAAFTQLAAFERDQPSGIGADEWTRRAFIAGDFVLQMFGAADGRFFAGTVTTGTPASDGIVPNGTVKGGDTINTFDSLDSNTFAVLAMANAPRYQTIDWRRPVRWLAAQKVTVTAAGMAFTGHSIVPKSFGGPEGIAWEFTGQTVAAMRVVDCQYGQGEFTAASESLVAQITQAQSSAPLGDGLGVVASTLQDGAAVAPREQCLSTPFQCIPQRVGLAATTWALFAEAGLNPLSPTPTLTICPPRPRRRAVRK
jgi:hypothetical protein